MHIQSNPYLHPPSLKNVQRFWNAPYQGLYIPTTYTLWALETKLTQYYFKGPELSPFLFHAGNIAFHALNGGLVFLILSAVLGGALAPLFGALFFVLHPVQVEPVAWISGLKDLSCGFFSLLSLWLYLLFRKGALPSRKSAVLYVAALIAFVLALLSKPAAVVIPFFLVVLELLYFQTLAKKIIHRLIPYLFCCLPILWITRHSQPERAMNYVTPWSGRALIVLDTLSFYLSKLVIPFFLATDYSRTPQNVLSGGWGYLALIALVATSILLVRRSGLWKTAALLFVCGLLPVLGIVPFYYQFFSTVADRYLYLALLGPSLAFAGYLQLKKYSPLTFSVCALLLLLYAQLSHTQTRVWKSDEALFSNVLRFNPNSLMAHNNLGTILERQDRFVEAAFHYSEAIRIHSDSLPARYNLGRIYARLGQFQMSVKILEDLLEREPRIAEGHYTLGMAYRELGILEKSALHFGLATELNPDLGRAHLQLGLVLKVQGKCKKALNPLYRSRDLNPLSPLPHLALSECLRSLGKFDAAQLELTEVLNREPQNSKAKEMMAQWHH